MLGSAVARKSPAILGLCLAAGLGQGLGVAARADIVVAVVLPNASTPAAVPDRGTEFAILDINAKGGLMGQRLRAVYINDGCEPETAEPTARKTLAEHPDLIVGHTCSGSSIGAAPFYASAGVVQITPNSTAPRLTEMGIGTVFRLIGRDDNQGVAAADLISKRWPKARIAVIDDLEPYGQGLGDAVRKELAAKHGNVVFNRSVAFVAANYPDLVTALKQNRIDVLYATAEFGEDLGALLKDMRAAGLKTEVVSGDSAGYGSLRHEAGDAANGLLFSYSPDPLLLPAAQPVQAEAKAHGVELERYEIRSYAAVQIWAEAVGKAHSTEGKAVAAALHKGRFDSAAGEVAFDAKGDLSGLLANWVWWAWGPAGYAPVTNP